MSYQEIIAALQANKTVHWKSKRYVVSVNDNGTLILTDAYDNEYVTWLMPEEYKDCFVGSI